MFVTYTPFVWLPAVMVLAALAGHLLIFRRDDDDALRNIGARNELLDRPKPNRPAIEIGERLLLLFAKS